MNKCILIGRLTNDPDIRQAQSGELVAHFRLAIDRNYGERRETDFINCVAFRKAAEFYQNYVHKGMKMAVVGHIQTGSYTDRDGRKVYTTDIIVEQSEFAEGKRQTEQQVQYQQNIPTQQEAPGQYVDGFMQIPDDVDAEGLPWNG